MLESLGLRKEAHLVENELSSCEVGWQSELHYAMLDGEWRAARSRPGD